MSYIRMITIHAHLRIKLRKETLPSSEHRRNNRSPLKVLSEDVPQQHQVNMDVATELAAQMGMTMAQFLGGAELPKAAIAIGRRREVESNANIYAEFACVVPDCLKA
jgi:hypothetical protein